MVVAVVVMCVCVCVCVCTLCRGGPVLVQRLRERLDALLRRKLETPSMDVGADPVVEAITMLMTTER
jgi:hypothetical protein